MPATTPATDIATLLGRLPMFNGLAPDELAHIAHGSRELRVGKGEILFHKGDPNHGFHLVVRGQIKLAFTSAQGNEKVVELIGEGQSFGEAIMFMERPYIVFAQALCDSVLLHIGKQLVFDELARDPTLSRRMLAGMAVRLHQLMNDVESYSLHSGTQRIIGYLLRELPEEGSDLTVTLPATKGIIASRLNLTQEHFSRILHDLAGQGLLAIAGRNIHIPSVTRLRQYEN